MSEVGIGVQPTSGRKVAIKYVREALVEDSAGYRERFRDETRALAHGHGVVYRGVKPENVHLTSGGRVKLADFGVGRAVGEERLVRLHSMTLTGQTGLSPGTFASMAPEQLDGRAAGPAAEVFACGLVVYEALMGRCPAGARAPMSGEKGVVGGEPGRRLDGERAESAAPHVTTGAGSLRGQERHV